MADAIAEPEISSGESDSLEVLKGNMDAFFLIVNGFIIFFMQGGFAFLEAGAVRTKNTVNILIKNMLDALIGGVSYWAVGWALAYGAHGNGFIGGSNFFSVGMEYSNYASWFFQFVFAATAATIVSGAIAERCQFSAYFVYSILITGLVYPPVSHWAWDGDTPGWLNSRGYKDFAGSGVVHLLGGTCAFVACFLIKPRHGRFDDNGKPVDMPGHSVPIAALGGFILLFGFLAFNGGSQAAISSPGDSDAVARAVVNTILGACGGGLTVLFVRKMIPNNKWSYLMTLNGSLAGMVGLCAGCNVYQPWAAILVGIMSGLAFYGCHSLLLYVLKMDDPLDAVAVHGAGGIVGIVSVPFFSYGDGILWAGDTAAAWEVLGWNLLGGLAIIAWSTAWSLAIFWPLAHFDMLRIDRETEFRGNDLIKHGESAYPADAWVELQYKRGGGEDKKISVMNGPTTEAGYNDAFQMMPSGGSLMSGLKNSFGGVAATDASNSHDNKAYNE